MSLASSAGRHLLLLVSVHWATLGRRSLSVQGRIVINQERAHILLGGRPSQAPEALSMCFQGDIPINTRWALIRSRSEMQTKATSCSIVTSLLNPDIVYISCLSLLHKLLPITYYNKAFASQESGYSFCESFGLGRGCLP